jgi:hypothetical protein
MNHEFPSFFLLSSRQAHANKSYMHNNYIDKNKLKKVINLVFVDKKRELDKFE